MNHWNAFESLPTTSEGWGDLTKLVLSDIDLGMVSALEAKIFFTRLSRLLDAVKDAVDASARHEAEQYGQNEFEAKGAKIQLREAGVSYDYASCHHPVYDRLKMEVKPVLEEIKGIEKTLQTLKGKMILTDQSTGETCEVFPPARKSKSIVVVTPL
jgi:hypothetical protein